MQKNRWHNIDKPNTIVNNFRYDLEIDIMARSGMFSTWTAQRDKDFNKLKITHSPMPEASSILNEAIKSMQKKYSFKLHKNGNELIFESIELLQGNRN